MLTKRQVYDKIVASPGYPELPEITRDLLRLLHQRYKADLVDMAEIAEKDPVLSERLLRSVNSPLFGSNSTVETVKDAVLLLGLESVRNITIQNLIIQFFPAKPLPGQHFDISLYWRHIVAVALVSNQIGRYVKHPDLFRLFTYCLLHDIGVIIIDACLPDLMDEIEAKMNNGIHQLIAEKLTLGGLTHNNVGAWISRKWDFGEPMTRVAEFHHTPTESPVLNNELRIIYISEILGERYYNKLAGFNLPETPIDSSILDALELREGQLTQIEEILPQLVDEFIASYGSV